MVPALWSIQSGGDRHQTNGHTKAYPVRNEKKRQSGVREYIQGSSFKLDGQRWPPLVNSAVMATFQDEQELAKPGRGRLGCRSEISASQGPLAVGMPKSESMA